MDRRILIALAVVVPVVVFVPMKIAASWRPIEMGRISQRGQYPAPAVEASARYVEAQGNVTSRLDLQDGRQKYVHPDEGFFSDGAWNWRVNRDDPIHPTRGQLELRDGNGAPVIYAIPVITPGSQGGTSVQTVALTRAENRLELVMGRRYYRWKLDSRDLERNLTVPIFDSSLLRLARDGETLMQAGIYETSVVSTHTGRVLRRLRFGGKTEQMPTQISASGRYAVYENRRVVDVQSGRALWRFDLSAPGSGRVQVTPPAPSRACFSPDEKLVALPSNNGKTWEIRDAQTGALVRKLPLVPGANTGAFTPDGATLYSVADGVLYRQRAR